jgi:glycosyltransferase involved in cell wall biosynthesis
MKIDKELSMSCIIPMHNEERNVKRIINDAKDIFSQLLSDWEIIIVESGSTDNTWKEIEKLVEHDKRIRPFHQEKKEGMGSALRLGYSVCTKDLICHLEADSPFDTTYFKKALPILIENNCVIGYRIGPKEDNFKWSYYNIVGNRFLRMLFHVGYNLLLRLVFGLVVRDANFSFKIFRRKDIQDVHFISKGWFFDAEILLELRRKGILPIEIPIEYRDRVAGTSTVNIFTPFHMLYEMAQYIKTRGKDSGKLRCQT